MKYFEIKNAVTPLRVNGRPKQVEPIVRQAGIWIGVLALPDDKVDVKEFLKQGRVLRELSQSDYDDLKKNKGNLLQAAVVNEPVPPGAVPAVVVEDDRPEKMEEVLIEGKAEPADPLDDEKPKAKPKPKKAGKK